MRDKGTSPEGAAIKAIQVAMIGDGNPKIINPALVGINQGHNRIEFLISNDKFLINA
jgi:hypothetical protein